MSNRISKSNTIFKYGPLLIVLCMFLRATDVVFRSSTLSKIDPLELITLEHLIACIVLLRWIPSFRRILTFSAFEIFCVLFISCGSSVGGILFFTSAFQYINPSVVILLQKLQPIVTIFLSYMILKERFPAKFWFWAAIGVGAGYVLGFGLSLPEVSFASQNFRGVIFALIAMTLWGSGTVFGKKLVAKLDPGTVTRYRYFLGLFFALVLLFSLRSVGSLGILTHPEALTNIVYMALVPGFLALALYYKGLQKTSASIASILELAFPLFAVLFTWLFLKKPLSSHQLLAGAVLLLSVVMISRIGMIPRASSP